MKTIPNGLLLIAAFCAIASPACDDSRAAEGWGVEETSAPTTVAPTHESDRSQPSPDEAAPSVTEVSERFVVHEWGTYTSLQGSDGEDVDGMHYEEESLPAFVHGRIAEAPTMSASKRTEEAFLAGVTQKLETPVIYFYGAPSNVDVRVDFPEGVISQWYPDATAFAPDVYSAPFSAETFQAGSMTWSLEVLPTAETAGLIEVPEDDVWAPSRNVDAQPVRFGDEVEKFVFYRGLGRFAAPFRVTSVGDNITMTNESADVVPNVWLLHWNGERGEVWELGELGPHGSIEFSPTPKELPKPDYLERARASLSKGLEESGLTADESWAMVDTWTHSYFHSTGHRVLYVAPRSWADEILPLDVQPAPDEVVRTLVGRVEVMLQSEEVALLSRLRSGELDVATVGRLAEPKLQRLLQLTDVPSERESLTDLIDEVRSGGTLRP